MLWRQADRLAEDARGVPPPPVGYFALRCQGRPGGGRPEARLEGEEGGLARAGSASSRTAATPELHAACHRCDVRGPARPRWRLFIDHRG